MNIEEYRKRRAEAHLVEAFCDRIARGIAKWSDDIEIAALIVLGYLAWVVVTA